MNKTLIGYFRFLIIIYFILSARVIAQEFQILDFGKIKKYFPLKEINTYELQSYILKKGKSFSQLFEYDDKENLIAVTFKNWGKSVPRNYIRYTFDYDEINNLMVMVYFEYIKPSWEIRGKTIFHFNENDYCRTIEEYRYRLEDSTFVKSCLIQNYYNSDNNIVQTLSSIWDNSEYVNYSIQRYYWNEDGELTLTESQKWENDNWVNYYRIVFVDDKKETLRSCTEQSWIDSAWADKIKIIKNYSEEGLLQEEIKSVWYEKNWLEESKWISYYNPNNSLAEQYYFTKGTEVWSKIRKLEYLYQEK